MAVFTLVALLTLVLTPRGSLGVVSLAAEQRFDNTRNRTRSPLLKEIQQMASRPQSMEETARQ